MPFERRLKLVQATPEVILESSKEGIRPATKVESWGWPPDARVIMFKENLFTNTLDVVIYSDTFPEVPEGALPSYLGHVPWIQELPKISIDKFQCETCEAIFYAQVSPPFRPFCPWCTSYCKHLGTKLIQVLE